MNGKYYIHIPFPIGTVRGPWMLGKGQGYKIQACYRAFGGGWVYHWGSAGATKKLMQDLDDAANLNLAEHTV
jgi:hypothetical protein